MKYHIPLSLQELNLRAKQLFLTKKTAILFEILENVNKTQKNEAILQICNITTQKSLTYIPQNKCLKR